MILYKMNDTGVHAAHVGLVPGLPENVGTVMGLVSLGTIFLVACFKMVLYGRRLCNNQDFVSDCIVGKSKLHFEVDTNGDGKIQASKKLVINMNTKEVSVEDTGVASPADVPATVPSASPAPDTAAQPSSEVQKKKHRDGPASKRSVE